jgi:hypothetical protein
MKQSTSKTAPKQPAVRSPGRAERVGRIAVNARDLVAIANGMPGDFAGNLTAICTAALCDAIARSRAS